ncbi:globin family protein [Rhodopseudomonas sp. BR0M22]|uniref:globin family protein n=1 Tax=Rhodopseudomonas sp. BR0M22 TaxID=2269369 RepID=UPI0013DF082D|nr:globin family protein [Rhodopseudomonas sp. BR0M22]NEW92948.1 hemin receptor [Rhodopseudomonas sp. BR0M22]
MTPQAIALVQQSFARLTPISDETATLFYERLFATAPELRALFHGDMRRQGKKLMSTLNVVVTGLTDLATILPATGRLARLHVAFGVSAAHYTPFGAALLWTLEREFGADWTPELAAAWRDAYAMLSETMLAAAYSDTTPS